MVYLFSLNIYIFKIFKENKYTYNDQLCKMEKKKKKTKPKELRFFTILEILLFLMKNIYSEIWWKEGDYREFQKWDIKKVMHLVEKYGQLTLHKAFILIAEFRLQQQIFDKDIENIRSKFILF